jgi:hypothetical protein
MTLIKKNTYRSHNYGGIGNQNDSVDSTFRYRQFKVFLKVYSDLVTVSGIGETIFDDDGQDESRVAFVAWLTLLPWTFGCPTSSTVQISNFVRHLKQSNFVQS